MNEIDKLYQKNKSRQALWRKSLVDRMSALEDAGIDCKSCPGHCCTQKRNSMQITLAEGLELYFDLLEKKLLDDALRDKLRTSIKDSRLDQMIFVKGKPLRRNYTCPLFELKGFGCPLSRNSKPFGCLGYNANNSNEIEGESCRSEVELLDETDQQFSQEIAFLSREISEVLGLPLDKQTIPQMILAIDEKLATS